jgi:hypothetical protein
MEKTRVGHIRRKQKRLVWHSGIQKDTASNGHRSLVGSGSSGLRNRWSDRINGAVDEGGLQDLYLNGFLDIQVFINLLTLSSWWNLPPKARFLMEVASWGRGSLKAFLAAQSSSLLNTHETESCTQRIEHLCVKEAQILLEILDKVRRSERVRPPLGSKDRQEGAICQDNFLSRKSPSNKL